MVIGLVPTEIVCPPVPWNELEDLDALFEALREHGAKGTDASLMYGFGLHLNPEVESFDADYLLAMLRAYLLLAGWLRDEIKVDITREMLPHANPFHKAYALKVLDSRYAPDLDTLIDDYLHYNPTRNRELDMLPLLPICVPTIVMNCCIPSSLSPGPLFTIAYPMPSFLSLVGARRSSGIAGWKSRNLPLTLTSYSLAVLNISLIITAPC
ncbi:hypothetical protein HSBAA_14320 [Vreelandella sulfidaeris]|uniref:Amidoligase enzyme n=1 Tax=Vreelandella sulfidaeris TaxID=115553 RepID=A0A455U2C2_9GAMM|nr:hypothetical protein HSBAA_14320 [Halomonas sulfidaeris]